MTRGPLPRFNAREGLSAISASAMNRLVDTLENAERRLVEVERRTLTRDTFERDVPSDRTIAIVRKPVAGDSTLTVREAGYANTIPKPCEGEDPNKVCYYEWKSPEFEAYPPLGMECIDYDGDEFTGATPQHDTAYHACTFRRGYWELEIESPGGSPVVFVKIVNFIGPSADTAEWLTVQRMKRVKISVEGATPVLYDWQPDGATEPAECWPNFVAAHYLPMRNQTPEVIVPMSEVDGSLYVWQKNRFFLGQPTTGFPQSDCQVPV